MNKVIKDLGKVSLSGEGFHSANKEYDRLCVVTDSVTKATYMSRKKVPIGASLNDINYWQPMGGNGGGNGIIVIYNTDSSTGEVIQNTLYSAIISVDTNSRQLGAILNFYGEDKGIIGWHIYKFNSINIDDWTDSNKWFPIGTGIYTGENTDYVYKFTISTSDNKISSTTYNELTEAVKNNKMILVVVDDVLFICDSSGNINGTFRFTYHYYDNDNNDINFMNILISSNYSVNITFDSKSIPTKISQLENDKNYLTNANIPTKISQLENDSNFITSADVKSEIETFFIDLTKYNNNDILEENIFNNLKEAIINNKLIIARANFNNVICVVSLDANYYESNNSIYLEGARHDTLFKVTHGIYYHINSSRFITATTKMWGEQITVFTDLDTLQARDLYSVFNDGNIVYYNADKVLKQLEPISVTINQVTCVMVTQVPNDENTCNIAINYLSFTNEETGYKGYNFFFTLDKSGAGTKFLSDDGTYKTVDLSLFKLVSSLPATNIDSNKVYLLQSEETEENNIYTEYIYINGEWEKIGSFKTNVDLTNYATLEKLNTLESKIPTKLSQLNNDLNINIECNVYSFELALDDSITETTYNELSEAINNGYIINAIIDGVSFVMDTSGVLNKTISLKYHYFESAENSIYYTKITIGEDLLVHYTFEIFTIPTKLSQLDNDFNYAKVSEVPTKVSQLTNDANYAKKSDIVNEIFILDMTSYVESNITDLADAANNNRAIIMIEITADGISTSHYNVVFNDLQTLMLQKFDNSASGKDVVVKTTSYTFDKTDGTYVKDENKITLYKTGKGNKVLSDDGTYKDWPAVVVTTQELYDEMDIDENTLYIIKE